MPDVLRAAATCRPIRTTAEWMAERTAGRTRMTAERTAAAAVRQAEAELKMAEAGPTPEQIAAGATVLAPT